MHITGIYAALSVLLVLALAARISQKRHGAHIGIGDGGDRDMTLRIRAHANALENLPLALLLLLLLDLDQLATSWLHVFGITLVLGRVMHAVGLSRTAGYSFGRFVGTILTWGVMAVMAVLLLWRAIALQL